MYSRGSFAFQWITLGITLLVLAVLWIPGFGFSPRGSRRVQLSGKATYNGQPVTNGAIVLKPTDGKNQEWGAAVLNPDGAFQLECLPGRDELKPGKYGVFFVFEGNRADEARQGQSRREEEDSTNDDKGTPPKPVAPTIPVKYTRVDSSGLWIVLGKEPQRVVIELKD